MSEERYTLKKDHLKSFLRKMSKEYRLVAPIRNRHGDLLFTLVEDLDRADFVLDEQPQNSIKQFLFPQQEALFSYRASGGAYEFLPIDEPPLPTVYFGVHPCDLSAVLYLDVVFSQGGRDQRYLKRRKDSLLIGVNCNQPMANCFCNATGHGPFLEFGSDLQLTDLGEHFLVELGRAGGTALIDRWRLFFEPAGARDQDGRFQAFLEARAGFAHQVRIDQAIRRLAADEVSETVWEELSLRCQDCGGCSYLCPTCSCFSISDLVQTEDSGLRLRSWDACTFAGFTVMAGGHNPVDHKRQAIRQRFNHKLRDDVKKYGRPSCVGCGRCVGGCFGGTDMIRFVEKACGAGL